MYIARILFPIEVLGPGKRVGIWFDGCEHHCKGCSNPELWKQQERYRTNAGVVLKLIDAIASSHSIDGFTLTGGDPFLQPDALRELLPQLRNYSSDILCYTGYQFGELKDKYQDILCQLAVLIDGEYVEAKNNGVFLRGSENQNVIILSSDYDEIYKNYMKNGRNKIQNFKTRDSVISVGIHSKEYDKELKELLVEKGLEEQK